MPKPTAEAAQVTAQLAREDEREQAPRWGAAIIEVAGRKRIRIFDREVNTDETLHCIRSMQSLRNLYGGTF